MEIQTRATERSGVHSTFETPSTPAACTRGSFTSRAIRSLRASRMALSTRSFLPTTRVLLLPRRRDPIDAPLLLQRVAVLDDDREAADADVHDVAATRASPPPRSLRRPRSRRQP